MNFGEICSRFRHWLMVEHREKGANAMSDTPRAPEVETHRFADDGIVPNNAALPLVVYRGALAESADRAGACERMFARHGWGGGWRNGIYADHHYHSTAHEVLGIARGNARVRLGGEGGPVVELAAGDVVVIPAGVAHKREAASADLLVIGAYPSGQHPDMCRAEAVEHDRALANIALVALPEADPVTGRAYPLFDCWREAP
jgi:uncharacterized protein YjlB